MRTSTFLCAALALAMLVLSCMVCAQTDMQQASATVEIGPVVRSGLPASADVFVNGKFAMRIPASAGGYSPMRRARMIADRLNNAFSAGARWEDMRVTQVDGNWVVALGDMNIATADSRSARAFRISPGNLAGRWGRTTVVALGGSPSTIAMQLSPVAVAVAGAREEIGVTWQNAPTKTVPLLNASTGNQMGSVIVAGPQSRLDMVNSVVVYTSTSDNATVYTFVPITSASVSGALTRVMNVGLVNLPSSVVPMQMKMGAEVADMVSTMATRWNNTINAALRQQNLQISGSTKIVPLYSPDKNAVVGAAQIVGTARAVTDANSVIVIKSDDMHKFNVSPATCVPFTSEPATLNNAVVSAIIVFPQPGATMEAAPSMPAPETMPEEETDTEAAPETAPATPY